MKKIETSEDVVNWAQDVFDGQGEKYTVLSKGDQFAIAKYILEKPVEMERKPQDTSEGYTGNVDTPNEAEPAHNPPPEPQAEPQTPQEDPHGDPETELLHPAPTPTPAAPVADTTTATMTRGYAYHRAGCDAQQAFDKFLEWVKAHPKDGSVMDFSTGVKSVDAAFAYWLNEIITLEIPRSV